MFPMFPMFPIFIAWGCGEKYTLYIKVKIIGNIGNKMSLKW